MAKIDKTKQFVKDAIDEMFKIAGIDLNFKLLTERLEKGEEPEHWYTFYTWSKDQEQEWLEWMRKEFKSRKIYTTKKMIEKEIQMFNLNYGLRIK